ncbi:MAG: DUF4173 domain-containing protein [Candidatus Blackburnbacteria bacterium]|nr:DUF4173 domain-containing protein [Candidatus Blackburnbacteria bacterium]
MFKDSLGFNRVIFSLVIALLFFFLMAARPWGLSFVIVDAAFLILFGFLYPKLWVKNWFLALCSLGLAAFFYLRSFEVDLFATLVTVILINSVLVLQTIADSRDLTLKQLATAPFIYLIRAFTSLFGFAVESLEFVRSRSGRMGSVKIERQLGGLILGGFLVLVFGFLYRAADPVFSRYIDNLIKLIPKIKIDQVLVTKIVQSGLVFGLILGLYAKKKIKEGEFAFLEKAGRFVDTIRIAVIAVCGLTAVFLAVQAQYLFAGDALLKSLGIMHSEYVRRGFFELVVVSAISLCLVWIMTKREKKKDVWLGSIFIGEVALLLSSAIWRDFLYQDNFGFTRARLLGFVFALWLLGVLGIFAARMLDKIPEKIVVWAVFVNTIVAVFVMNFMNIDRLVGVVKSPSLGYAIDYGYIGRLSSDGWEGWEKGLAHFEKQANERKCTLSGGVYAWHLESKLEVLRKKPKDLWAMSQSDKAALDYLEKNNGRLENLRNRVVSCEANPV